MIGAVPPRAWAGAACCPGQGSRGGLEANGRRHIRAVIGPDEYHKTIDDNASTNVMACWTIRRCTSSKGPHP